MSKSLRIFISLLLSVLLLAGISGCDAFVSNTVAVKMPSSIHSLMASSTALYHASTYGGLGINVTGTTMPHTSISVRQ